VSAETLSSATAAGSEPAVIEHGPHLHPETVRRLTCDSALVTMLENDQGEVLNVGRKTRVIQSAIRRALWARDTQCQFPGCSHTRYLDGHHIVHWANGGETKLANLVLLCRRHHRYVHEQGFVVERSSNGIKARGSG
ncbi:MAG: HNH endonuclease, partial [Pseudomonadales bacterium]